MGKLTILRRGTVLHVERRYQFVDEDETLMDEIAGGRLAQAVEWSTIPANVQDALLTIDAWCYAQILAQEDMA